MSKLVKRIYKDILELKNQNLEENGIYCIFSESNIKHVKILIIGPSDTPYEGGFYFFNLYFPDNYPFEPPHVKFMTHGTLNGYSVRFNPNLYTNGKVCLSILNTWAGPGWTVCCTLKSVLLSIQTLLNEYPLHNEPGWESVEITDNRCIQYNAILTYANLKIAILKMLQEPPREFEEFKDIMIEHIRKNKDFILNRIEKKDTILKSTIFFIEFKTSYTKLKEEYSNLFKKYNIISKEIKMVKRKAPKENSNKYDFGYTMQSENDGHMYIVSITKSGKKRWKKLNE